MKTRKETLILSLLGVVFICLSPLFLELLQLITQSVFNSSLSFYLPLKNIGSNIFKSREVMWVAISGFITACGILSTLIYQKVDQEAQKRETTKRVREKLIWGLKHELIYNFNAGLSTSIFVNTENNIYNFLKENYVHVKDLEKLNKLITIFVITGEYDKAVSLRNDDLTFCLWKKYTLALSLLGFLNQSDLLSESIKNEISRIDNRAQQWYRGKGLAITMTVLEGKRPEEYRRALESLSSIYLRIKPEVLPFLEKLTEEVILTP